MSAASAARAASRKSCTFVAIAAFRESTPAPVSALMRYSFGSMGLSTNSLPPAAAMESSRTFAAKASQTSSVPGTSILFATTMRGRAAKSLAYSASSRLMIS